MAKRETTISLPELMMVAGTRTALGTGIGLIFADRLNRDQRRAAGLALLFVGVVSTIPLSLEILGGRIRSRRSPESQEFESAIDRAA